ncbi:pyrroline-5-carboxylate reductase [Pseudobacteriovorax antillogorgiicola]|uniref:Pyrroline-5-carboxylate reductase n=1 Tax=Pseudobacteriovorax antillogorgiicola TaxID=1513793 RepID=A0A1Y6CD35_9BACT|nr:pyrroline-5-carboxylate reductase [Pseudobacteriovorax antillogorgiicola]TCS48625.1 pyrroline-5-carboxylate reductase [Pseudobacteriovorax antillogorgiicola]SMF55406.1 pyrroline-5-carboxylate reductase [Pseudobacteriovorax antillogorgiicola]
MAKALTVIGLGNMGGSMVKGLLKSPLKDQHPLKVFDLHPDIKDQFAEMETCQGVEDLSLLGKDGECLIFCVKPHDLKSLAETLRGKIDPDCLVLSILAGVRIETIQEELDFQGGVVRAMPNIAATIGEAATAMCCNANCSKDQKELAERVFQAVGEAYWTKESLMDTVTGLSGSGPAYIYMVIEALTDGGVKMGLPRSLSQNLATQTVLGAAALVKHTGQHPAILKDQVTTPAGTTISALHELEERGLRSMFVSAVEKATDRSRFLGESR